MGPDSGGERRSIQTRLTGDQIMGGENNENSPENFPDRLFDPDDEWSLGWSCKDPKQF